MGIFVSRLARGAKDFRLDGESFQKVMTPGDRSRPEARGCLNGTAKRIYRSLYSNRVGGGRHWDTFWFFFKECIINSNHYKNKYYDFLFLKKKIEGHLFHSHWAILFDFSEYADETVKKNTIAAANTNKREERMKSKSLFF